MSGCFLYASGLGKGSFSCDICAPGLDEPGVPTGIAASGCLGAVGVCRVRGGHSLGRRVLGV